MNLLARCGAAALLCTAALALPVRSALAQVDRVQQVKAAYLYNFARFTTWPASKAPAAGEPIRFCVLESDPLAPAMAEALQGKTIDAQPLVLRRVQKIAEMRDCHLAYLGAIDPARLATALDELSGSGALTVYEGPDTRDGAIRLFVEDRKLRFEINTRVTRREHLELSSHLLSVARLVGD